MQSKKKSYVHKVKIAVNVKDLKKMSQCGSDSSNRSRAATTPRIPKWKLPTDVPKDLYLVDSDESTSNSTVNVSGEIEQTCKSKTQSSFALCLSFMAFGSSMAILGPTALELGCLIGAEISQMSWIFFTQACSAMLGASSSGVLLDCFRVNYNIFLGVVLILHGVVLALMPLTRTLSTLLLMTAAHGLMGGCQDTAINVRMMIIHGRDVAPYLQTMFFFYSIGAFTSPIIASNFLSVQCNKNTEGYEIETRRRRYHLIKHFYHMKHKNHTTHLTVNYEDKISQVASSDIHFAYLIVGLISMVVSIGLWYLAIFEWRQKIYLNNHQGPESCVSGGQMQEESQNDNLRVSVNPKSHWQVICLTVWISVMVFVCEGLQEAFGSYIYTYAVKSEIGISSDDAAYLNSVFWGAVALGRLMAIFVSLYVCPRLMLVIDIAGCLASIIMMFILRYHVLALWICTAAFGVCLSNTFPTSLSVAESFFPLSGIITCIFVVSGGTGEMVVPLIIGKLFDVIGPMSFVTTNCVACFASVGVYVAIIMSGHGIQEAQMENTTSTGDNAFDNTKLSRRVSIEQINLNHITIEEAGPNLKSIHTKFTNDSQPTTKSSDVENDKSENKNNLEKKW